MININDKAKCCGCGACEQICPQNALSMTEDEKGFIYPALNEALCVNCKLCEKVCLYQRQTTFPTYGKTYVAYATDCDLRESASGGVFASIADSFLRNNGIVCGCAMMYQNAQLTVQHIIVSNTSELLSLKGSKYVQSDIRKCFKTIRHYLENGRNVLFSGTPCQVAALKGFLLKEYSNLFCIELICHGVPSQKMFQDYIAEYERRNNEQVKKYYFRDKSFGWSHCGKLVSEHQSQHKEIYFPPEKSSYYQNFLDGYINRDSCYHCPYPGRQRPGDITIGDYWGIKKVHPELLTENGGSFNTYRGLSCMMVNTDKGKQLLCNSPGIKFAESDLEKASKYNEQILRPVALKPEREIILNLYAKNGYKAVEKWYTRRRLPQLIKNSVKKVIPVSIKLFIRQRLGK